MSVFISLNTSFLLIKKNKFINNSADFGSALNLEHRGAIVHLIENLFEQQKIPKHVIGNGACIKTSGFWNTHTISERNIFMDSFSIAIGAISLFAASISDTNSTFISKKR